MKKAVLFAMTLPAMATAAAGISGFVQEHASVRLGSKDECVNVRACRAMVNEQRAQLLGEWQPADSLGISVRADAINDAAIGKTRLLAREAYIDYRATPQLSLRAGRQVITWGVGDYLFVNDIFPKNYDAFFTGKPFDHMKESVDGVKLNAYAADTELELVWARPRQDQGPAGERFIAAAMPAGVPLSSAKRGGGDIALRVARKLGRWDAALYAARYHSREAGLFASGPGLLRASVPTRHVGASATGNIGSGVVLMETAYSKSDLRVGGVNPFLPGERFKALLGYSRELGQDLSVSVQYHHEAELDYDAYRNALAPTVAPADRMQQTAYVRVQQRLFHQTLGLGIQLFASFDGGTYANPFVSYSIADGLNLEAGANVFDGPATSRYGMMRHDKNVYASLRYSF
jgi:hypothetical protein